MFWNRKLADRKHKLHVRADEKGDTTYERRFLCPNCVWYVLGDVVDTELEQ